MPSLRKKKQPSPDFLPTPLSSTSSIHPAAVQRHGDMARPPRIIDRSETDAVLRELRRRSDDYDYEKFDCENLHRFELDAEGRLRRLFWVDAESRIGYNFHGDVVVLDTTCRANKYGLPFVAFLGLTHHRSPAFFGCGVVSDDSLDSYVWLLRAAITCQDRPKSVITDGCDAVVEAVNVVFPDASHRICSSHVERGVREHLHGSPSAQNAFRSLMCDDTCSPGMFEARWSGFMARHRTSGNGRWLDAMYGKKELWAAAFVHGRFFLGMANDQTTECLATRMHTGLHVGMSLADLVAHVDACERRLRLDMAKLDVAAARSRVELTTRHRCLEEDAAQWFTPANFYLVREEIKMADSFEIAKMVTTVGNPTFNRKVYLVRFKQRPAVCFDVECSGRDDIKCSCRKMEREGLPCRHIFTVLIHSRKLLVIPKCCRLSRLQRRGDIKEERVDEMNELGRQVFELASEDAQEFRDIKGFFEAYLNDIDRRRGTAAVVDEDNVNDAADAESGAPMVKKIKLFDN
nr:unnamed protein product [Digitaria exilis]